MNIITTLDEHYTYRFQNECKTFYISLYILLHAGFSFIEIWDSIQDMVISDKQYIMHYKNLSSKILVYKFQFVSSVCNLNISEIVHELENCLSQRLFYVLSTFPLIFIHFTIIY